MMRSAINRWLIARTILLEAVRRQELYVIVLISVALLGGLRFVKFFDIEGLGKFYREVSLKTMNLATALTAILLAARQLPREFKNRTLYPLLAKPVSRLDFLLGKFFGVMLAAGFCYGLFMLVFLAGSLTLRAKMNYPLFVQAVYLQAWSIAVLVAMTFVLSLLFNTDAAITLSAILCLSSQVLMTLMSYLYDYVGRAQQWGLLALHFLVPQLTLFDLSAKIVHEIWPPIPAWAVWRLTLYGAGYTAVFLALAYLLFRRRPI